MIAKTPGQAAREEFAAQSNNAAWSLDWDAIAAAAIEAAKQSGDKPAFSCPKCGESCSSNGCSKHTTPPTENKDEREQTAKRFVDDFTEHDAQDEEYHETVGALSGLLAAADAAGYERACQEANTLRNQHLEAQLRHNDRLQARYDRLEAAARDVPTPYFARRTREGWAEIEAAVLRLRTLLGDEPGPQPTSGNLISSFQIGAALSSDTAPESEEKL